MTKDRRLWRRKPPPSEDIDRRLDEAEQRINHVKQRADRVVPFLLARRARNGFGEAIEMVWREGRA